MYDQNSTKELLLKLRFFIYYLFSYRGKKFHWKKVTKFWQGDENFPWRKISPDESFAQQNFPWQGNWFSEMLWRCQKYALLSISMQRPKGFSLKTFFADVMDLAFIGQITFSRNLENNWKKNVNLKLFW